MPTAVLSDPPSPPQPPTVPLTSETPTEPLSSSPSPSNLTKLTSCSTPKKLLLLQFFLLTIALFIYQLYTSTTDADNLPGAMANAFRHHPDQNLPILLSTQKIFALQTSDTRYAYCAIPKNGCTYHISLLHRINGVEDYEKMGIIHDASAKSHMDITRFPNEEIVDWLRDANVPKYIVVRNPMTRTLSAYIDKVERHLHDDEKTPQAFADWVDFEFPVGSVKRRSGQKWNPHWRPQTYFCGFRTPNVHKAFRVLRFEQTEEIVDYLYAFVPRKYLDDGWGGEANESLREFMLGPRKRTGGTEDKFLDYFTSVELFDKLGRVLAPDIEMLGYQEEVGQLREQVRVAEMERQSEGER